MYFDFGKLPPNECYKLFVSTITPRPIAWVVSQSGGGTLNAAPFSFFNAFAADPPVIGIGIGSHKRGRPKDTRCNIEESRQFVVNLVSEDNAKAMNVTAIDFDYGVNELDEAGLTLLPSTLIHPPRIAESPVAFECELIQSIALGEHSGLILGRVLAMHLRDDAVIDPDHHYVDTPSLKLIGRMHGAGWYARTSDLFKMDRIPLADWNQDRPR
ncbi:flavin reductase family protein [Schlesneria sp. T3-172]|uniref:flavin reductase family protein n=1 Tax=Schlesneria sphaerica TaxID=3373610 RepID=UPI0037C676A0